MTNHLFPVLAVARKEFRSWFASPIGYVYLVFFVLVSMGIFFLVNRFFDSGQVTMRGWFGFLPWIYLFFVPAFGMGLWSQERGHGTIEVLLTLPIQEWQAVLGKFLAGIAFLKVSLLCTITLPFTLTRLGDPDLGSIFASYIGSVLLGGAFLAVSMFLSSLTRNQVVAFILSITVLFVLLLIGHPAMVQMAANAMADSPLMASVINFLSWLGLLTHFGNIARGVVDSRDLAYYAVVIATFLYLNIVTIQGRKWK